MRAKEARPTPRALTFAIVALLFLGSVLLVAEMTAAAAVTVPYAANPVADVDLDGDPATGDWTGSTTTTVPLENGQGGGYGTATLRAKHDGTVAYYRLDGQIDVPWTSAGGNHFWLGWQVSPADTTHHGGGTWDGAFFGLWDGTDYAPQPSYPPAPVDTFGFQRPPTADASQDLLGRLRYSGASAPYAFTAEWKKALNTGDADDLVYVADGTTVYNFFSTTDSNGAGSGGGGINHRGTTNTNTLVFAAPPGNSPPAVDLTSPDGGEDWTGGSAHTIFWNMSDVETATPSLKVWLNYSTNGGLAWSAIAGAQGITGLSSPSSFAWTVPAVDTAQARVRATVVDGSGTATSDTSAANFQIDSMSPTATGTPTGGGVSVNTWVNVSFSEAMAQASAQGAFELRRVSDWALVPTVSQGWVGNVMRYSPASALAFTTTYQGNVSTAAKDASRPGNALGTPYTFTFTTQTPADTQPPSVVNVAATPDPQETGLAVNLTADVTDNIAVAGAWVEVFDPGAALLGNFSMGYDIPSAAYFHSAAYVPLGLYTFQVHATDSSGNWASGSGTFLVRDSMPPTIRGLAAAPDPQETGLPVNITATVTDTVAVQSVSAGVTDPLGAPLGNLTMSRLGATDTYFLEQAYALVGVYGVALWASDPAGNFATASTTFTIVDTQPPAVLWVSATPPVQEPGLPVNLTAGVTDNRAVQSVTANVTDPGGVPVGNFTMAPLASPDYAYEAPYTTLGVYGVVVWALDASGNTASASSSFEVRDQQPPVITHTPPASVPVGVAIRVTAQVTDNVAVADVRLDFTDVSASRFNVSMGLNLTQYEIDIPGQPSPGLVTYFLWAIDGSGNVRITSTFTVAVLAPDTAPPSISGVAATPSPQNIGGTVTLTAGVTDNVGVAGVWVEVHGPGGGLVGNTSAASSGGTYSLAAAYVAVGTYTFQFAAVDTSGNWAVASGTFVIADLEPPVANAGPDRVIWIGTATVLDGTASTDNVLVTGFVWTFTYRGAPITLSSSVASFRFDEAGIYAVTLTVSDAAGWTETDAVTVTVVRDTTPPPVPSGIVLQPGAADCLGLTWIPSVADDLAGYSVYRYNATSERFERVGNLTAAELAFHDCGLAPGVEYLYWVVAVDENGTVSAPSVIVHRALPSTPTTPTTPEPMPYLLLGVFVLPAGLVIFALRRRRKGEPQEATAPSDSPTAADAPSEVPEASLPGPTREEWPPPP